MNTTQNSQMKNTSRFGSVRSLGRGIALSSAVAVMGLGAMQASDASAAGVSHGVRYASSAPASSATKPAPTDLTPASSQIVVRTSKSSRG